MIPRFKDRESFSDLEIAVGQMMQNPDRRSLDKIKYALNKIFKNTNCKEVIYTSNDKLFFGMTVMPKLADSDVQSILLKPNDRFQVTEYFLEIDSKLIELARLDATEVTACILHEVGHVVADSTTVPEMKKALDLYLADKDDQLNPTKVSTYIDLLRAGVADSIRKVDTIFSNQEEEYIADEFVVACGYGQELESACKKIVRNTGKLNKDVRGKFTVLKWTLNIYKNMQFRRIPALQTLNKGRACEGSTLVKRNINSMILTLNNKTYNGDLIEESFKSFLAGLGDKYRYNAINTLEDELYEYNMKVKTVDVSDEAMVILREINSRMALLSDYIESTNRTEDPRTVKRCEALFAKYSKLRDELMKKNTYDEKYYGLFMKDVVVKSRYEL